MAICLLEVVSRRGLDTLDATLNIDTWLEAFKTSLCGFSTRSGQSITLNCEIV